MRSHWFYDWKIQPANECPNFDECSVNKCPLHFRYKQLMNVEGDPETECKALRSTREEIAKRHPKLRNKGLLITETARDRNVESNKRRWSTMSQEERQKVLDMLAINRAKPFQRKDGQTKK